MKLTLRCGSEATPLDLTDGTFTVGGGEKDDIRYDGLPVKLVTLTVDGARLSLKASRPLRIGPQLFPAQVTRLVMPGETLKLPNDVEVIRPDDEAARERRRAKSTDFLAKELLGSNELPHIESRAATLTCVAGPDEGHVFPIAYLETTVGRGDEVDVRLRDRTVSRSHAKVIQRRGAYVLEDVATTNGVYVNGKRVKRSHELNAGDVIELGHSVLRFEAGERAPEERTRIEPLPLPPPKLAVVPEPIAETQPIVEPRTFDKEALLVIALGAALMITGLVTAAFFVR